MLITKAAGDVWTRPPVEPEKKGGVWPCSMCFRCPWIRPLRLFSWRAVFCAAWLVCSLLGFPSACCAASCPPSSTDHVPALRRFILDSACSGYRIGDKIVIIDLVNKVCPAEVTDVHPSVGHIESCCFLTFDLCLTVCAVSLDCCFCPFGLKPLRHSIAMPSPV